MSVPGKYAMQELGFGAIFCKNRAKTYRTICAAVLFGKGEMVNGKRFVLMNNEQ